MAYTVFSGKRRGAKREPMTIRVTGNVMYLNSAATECLAGFSAVELMTDCSDTQKKFAIGGCKPPTINSYVLQRNGGRSSISCTEFIRQFALAGKYPVALRDGFLEWAGEPG